MKLIPVHRNISKGIANVEEDRLFCNKCLEILSMVTTVEILADGVWGKSNMPITITSHSTQLVLP